MRTFHAIVLNYLWKDPVSVRVSGDIHNRLFSRTNFLLFGLMPLSFWRRNYNDLPHLLGLSTLLTGVKTKPISQRMCQWRYVHLRSVIWQHLQRIFSKINNWLRTTRNLRPYFILLLVCFHNYVVFRLRGVFRSCTCFPDLQNSNTSLFLMILLTIDPERG